MTISARHLCPGDIGYVVKTAHGVSFKCLACRHTHRATPSHEQDRDWNVAPAHSLAKAS